MDVQIMLFRWKPQLGTGRTPQKYSASPKEPAPPVPQKQQQLVPQTWQRVTLHGASSSVAVRRGNKMESPHEQQQSLLLSRIITNIEKLNEAVMMMNRNLQDVNVQNMNVELVAQMFKNYQSNVLFHLEAHIAKARTKHAVKDVA
ncbi:uncharacterized protein A1O5_01244 [Cladophialophora psammophila CBS 110553]|uniref:DASH complex subunit DAD4 n=1 Tax=Cladophialophora psammophila CBS 110553 TaxID=1182543 RepID=W9XIF4_9EURO|nr:uncharacterized protein A1O5_01244 [Cladophialophora psammophila CBS 110553]EXJ76736.1 hypothetical protein A1O5_01244 [Cladophialophora psammophila CBS 110553]